MSNILRLAQEIDDEFQNHQNRIINLENQNIERQQEIINLQNENEGRRQEIIYLQNENVQRLQEIDMLNTNLNFEKEKRKTLTNMLRQLADMLESEENNFEL